MEVQVREACPVCNGLAYTRPYQCNLCRQEIDPIWWTRPVSERRALPCGHDIRHLAEPVTCRLCWGEGYKFRWVSVGEFRELLQANEALGVRM